MALDKTKNPKTEKLAKDDPLRLAFLKPSRDRQRAMKARQQATAELRELIPAAAAAGHRVSDIARWAGMTRRAVYAVLDGVSETKEAA